MSCLREGGAAQGWEPVISKGKIRKGQIYVLVFMKFIGRPCITVALDYSSP